MSRRIEDLEPGTQSRCRVLLSQAQAQGIKLVVVQTWRTLEEQAFIWQQGRSRPGPIVSYARPGYSWHNFRRAFDVAFRVGTTGVSWRGKWSVVGAIGESLGLGWGGRFKDPDRGHFQYPGRMTLKELRAAAGLK